MSNEIEVGIGFIQRKENVWVPQWKNAVVCGCVLILRSTQRTYPMGDAC